MTGKILRPPQPHHPRAPLRLPFPCPSTSRLATCTPRSFSTLFGRRMGGQSSRPNRCKGCGLPTPAPRAVEWMEGGEKEVAASRALGMGVPPGEAKKAPVITPPTLIFFAVVQVLGRLAPQTYMQGSIETGVAMSNIPALPFHHYTSHLPPPTPLSSSLFFCRPALRCFAPGFGSACATGKHAKGVSRTWGDGQNLGLSLSALHQLSLPPHSPPSLASYCAA